jgi:hypothetical protein
LTLSQHHRGRTAGYPTAPSQIPACGFPHRAPQYCSLRTEIFAYIPLLFPAVRFAYVYQPVLSAYVSFMGYTIPSFPSPCEWPYCLRVLWNDLTPTSPSNALLAVETFYLLSGDWRASQVPDASLTTCHALGPRQSLGTLTIAIPLCWLLGRVKTVANCSDVIYGAELLWEGTSSLRPAVFSVYASPILFVFNLADSATGATLGTGCWLGFARLGLPACCLRQGTL